jgi:hypothetical protein
MITVTIRIKSAISDLTHGVKTVSVVKLLKSINGERVTGLVYVDKIGERHIIKISMNHILTIDGIDYNMGNMWENQKFENVFRTLSALENLNGNDNY